MSDTTGAGRRRGSVPHVDRPSLWDRIWRPFWVLPFTIVLGAILLAAVLPWVDRTVHEIPFVFQGGPEGARSLLSTIASAMISVTGLVFSITMVVLQLAQSQFTPRLLDTFLGNRTTQATLGVFTASFVYALAVLRTVRGSGGDVEEFVPQLSVTAAFLLVLAAVAMFIAFIHDITTTVQVTTVIGRIGRRTVELIDEQFGPPGDGPGGFGPTWSPRADLHGVPLTTEGRHGTLDHVDHPRLVAVAREHDIVIHLDVSLGAFVAPGQRVGTVWGAATLDDGLRRSLDRTLGIVRTRTMTQDISFGIRQLVDIAERALSPGINDPTTAVQVLDEIHVILRELAVRRTISPYIADDDGAVRVVHRPPRFADLLALALDEVLDQADAVQVPRRVEEMLREVHDVARPENRAAVVVTLERHALPGD